MTCFFFCIRQLNWMKAAPETKLFRNYAKQDPAKFCENLRGVNWFDRMNSSGTANENVICVDKLWLNFKSAFLKVADRHAPLIQKRVRGVDNCPWMTGQIKKDIRQRDYFLKKARKSSRDEDWLAYKSMRNRVTNSQTLYENYLTVNSFLIFTITLSFVLNINSCYSVSKEVKTIILICELSFLYIYIISRRTRFEVRETEKELGLNKNL